MIRLLVEIMLDLLLVLILWFVLGGIKSRKIRVFLRAGVLSLGLLPGFHFFGSKYVTIDFAWSHMVVSIEQRDLARFLEAALPVAIVWIIILLIGLWREKFKFKM